MFNPRGQSLLLVYKVYPWVPLSLLGDTVYHRRQSSPQGAKFTPRGQNSPQGTKFTPRANSCLASDHGRKPVVTAPHVCGREGWDPRSTGRGKGQRCRKRVARTRLRSPDSTRESPGSGGQCYDFFLRFFCVLCFLCFFLCFSMLRFFSTGSNDTVPPRLLLPTGR
jgi:hypothetical protein